MIGISRLIVEPSDPLPFKFLSQHQTLCHNSIFIDIDYEKLMREKCNIIQSTDQLSDLISSTTDVAPNDQILLQSPHYVAAACDLSDVSALEKILDSLIVEKCPVMFIAEVSMTYMEVDAADSVVALASKFRNGEFLLLEQWMPDGPDHPFASTMIKHFEKLGSPLKSPMRYQDSASLKQRFESRGWTCVDICSLWDLWSRVNFVNESERMALDQIEPFDEWEEFVLYGSHYFLLIAISPDCPTFDDDDRAPIAHQDAICTFCPYSAVEQLHRHSAQFRIGNTLISHGGLGTRGRTGNGFLYSINRQGELSSRDSLSIKASKLPQAELVYHTTTTMPRGAVILVGGRTAPHLVSTNCGILHRDAWQPIAELPEGRYRHSAVYIDASFTGFNLTTVLLFGGRNSKGDVLDSWLLWYPPTNEWLQLEILGDAPCARFSAAMSVNVDHAKEGHLCGGMGEKRTILDDLWEWELVLVRKTFKIKCSRSSLMIQLNSIGSHLCRLGAQLIESSTCLYLSGGVCGSQLIPGRQALIEIGKAFSIRLYTVSSGTPTPLLVGCSVDASISNRSGLCLHVTGGGAVCFSFGMYWNNGSYSFSITPNKLEVQAWMVLSSERIPAQSIKLRNPNEWSIQTGQVLSNAAQSSTGEIKEKTQVHVPGVCLKSSEEFANIVDSACPQVLKSLNIGCCTTTWDPDYLKNRIGTDRQVVVHSSSTAQMDFLDKNFSYETKTFAEFIDDIQSGKRLYLRSLSSEKPLKKPTRLEEDFPCICQDFELPPELEMVATNLHSSPLRISGPVNMWLHFDVMANVLCQIRGRKRLVLFHPGTVDRLGIPHGASSSKMQIFDEVGQLRGEAKALDPLICDLEAGDVLFIPALWLHAAFPTDGISIAVNCFFRSLESGYAAGKDTYGNRDVQAYENGRRDIQRIQRSFQELPFEFRTFYLKRLASELAP